MIQQEPVLERCEAETRRTLGDVVEESEATLFVGRAAELQALDAAIGAARTRSGAVYVHGPSGVGKSALLKAFARSLQARNVPVLQFDGMGTNRTAEFVDHAMATELGLPTDGYGPSAAIAATVNERALPNGFALIIDHYDDLVQADYWLRGQLFRQLGPGVCLILAGRTRAAQLWSHDLGWTRAITELPIRDLSEQEVGEFLRRCGVNDPVVWAETYAITGGRPQLLGLAANALLLQPDAAANRASRQSSSRLALFLIEHILHPGSRRRSWRAGTGSSDVDTTVATAAVLPSFDISELTALVGRPGVQGTWPALLRLTSPTHDGLRYKFPEPLRRHLAEAVAQQRPWAERQWRRTAIRYHLRLASEVRAGNDGGTAWSQIAELAREAGWWERLNPPALREGTLKLVRGPAAADLADASSTIAGSEWAARLSEAGPNVSDGLIVAQGPEGSLDAAMLAVPASAETWALLTGIPHLAASMQDLPAGAPGCWFGSSLLVALLAPANPQAVGALVGEACRDGWQFDRIVAIGSAQWTQRGDESVLLDSLGLQPPSPRTGAGLRILDLGQANYVKWLTSIARPNPELSISPRQWMTAAKEALQLLHEPDLLLHTVAGEFYARLGGARRGGSVRAWLLDALASADLGDAPPSGRVLLTLYYVDRIGPHEVIAERMNLPRTTYFRCHRQAVNKFAESLFSLA